MSAGSLCNFDDPVPVLVLECWVWLAKVRSEAELI